MRHHGGLQTPVLTAASDLRLGSDRSMHAGQIHRWREPILKAPGSSEDAALRLPAPPGVVRNVECGYLIGSRTYQLID
jgi:hypothetical protein